MALPAVFTPEQEAQIAQRRAAGESTPSIARSLGTSHQNVQNSLRRTGGVATGVGDDFEKAQLAALRRIKRDLRGDELGAQGRALLTKALNDTIKAIRMHRLVKPPEASAKEAGAERVLAKLQRLSDRKAAVEEVLIAIEGPSAEVETGT